MQPTDAQAAAEIAKLIGYLQGHQERLDYRFARKGGYPMGSGGKDGRFLVVGTDQEVMPRRLEETSSELKTLWTELRAIAALSVEMRIRSPVASTNARQSSRYRHYLRCMRNTSDAVRDVWHQV
jgi:hypothetical protein